MEGDRMTGNIKERYAERLNRFDEKRCKRIRQDISMRNWSVLNEPTLYLLVQVATWGIVASAICMFGAIRMFGESDWFAVPLLFCVVVAFITAWYLGRKYGKRVLS